MERDKITTGQCAKTIDSLRKVLADKIKENDGKAFTSAFEIFGALQYDLDQIQINRRESEKVFGHGNYDNDVLYDMLLELSATAIFAATCVQEKTCDWI